VKGKKSRSLLSTYPIQQFPGLEISPRIWCIQQQRMRDLVIVSFHGGRERADRQHVPYGSEKFWENDRGDSPLHPRHDRSGAALSSDTDHTCARHEIYKDASSPTHSATSRLMPHHLRGVNGLSLVLEVRLATDGSFAGGVIHL